jgi:hypothetical protein
MLVYHAMAHDRADPMSVSGVELLGYENVVEDVAVTIEYVGVDA